MTRGAVFLVAASAAAMLIAARKTGGQVEAGEGDYIGGFSAANILDLGESWANQITEQGANVSEETAGRNIAAFLTVLQASEGTCGRGDPYRVCYGYKHTISDLSDHPAVTGEWRGEVLSDGMCRNAGFGPGCVSSAAGAYQIIKGTWLRMRDALGLPDFSPASQDAAAVELVRRRGALEDVKAGRFDVAVNKCRNEWASLPGNYAGQGQRTIGQLAGWFQNAGGAIA